MTRAQLEAAAVAHYLERHGFEPAEERSYGRGEHYIRIPIPAAARNRRKSVTLMVRRVEPLARAS